MADQGACERRERSKAVLPELECRRLLATRTRGRVGLTIGALPVIMPVEYHYGDGVITFGIDDDAKLENAADGHVLAFEVDAYDPESGCEWSVHVLGRAAVITDDADALLSLLEAERAGASSGHSVRLLCEIVDGRFLADSCT
jgi:nitroimidazol reductase NimA-like FMN-containing flavoprotein (pyridoxamine 5'-phosphate oxidase superfamily)